MPTAVTCPNGHQLQLDMTLSGVTFGNLSGMNVPVDCPVCGVQFDAAPGDDVEATTQPDGRLSIRQAVSGLMEARRVLADLDPDQLVAVRVALEEVAAGRADESAVAAASDGLKAWMRNNPTLAQALITTFGASLTAILVALLNLWAQQGREPATPPPPPPPHIIVLDHYPSDDDLDRLARDDVKRQDLDSDS